MSRESSRQPEKKPYRRRLRHKCLTRGSDHGNLRAGTASLSAPQLRPVKGKWNALRYTGAILLVAERVVEEKG